MTPSVEVIIPTRNRPAELAACVRALLDQRDSDNPCPIVISDDGDGAMPEFDAPAVTSMRGPKTGPGANRNAAAKRSEAEWLIFVDDDCIPQAGFLAGYSHAIRSVPAGAKTILFGKTLGSGGPQDSMLWESPGFAGTDIIPPSCNFAIRRSLLCGSGGFDEFYCTMFEDMELFSRLRLSGAEFEYVPEAFVIHPRRLLPGASKLGDRWQSRVRSAYDLGASPAQILLLLPKHVAAVILSRFREPEARQDRGAAAVRFLGEFFFFLIRLPEWVRGVARTPRSAFWQEMQKTGQAPRRFGL